MSIAAGRTFIAAAKVTIKGLTDDSNVYYTRFIRNKEVPTAQDVRRLAAIVKEMEKVAKYYHTDVKKVFQTFGGPSDTVIRNTKTLYNTVKSKVK